MTVRSAVGQPGIRSPSSLWARAWRHGDRLFGGLTLVGIGAVLVLAGAIGLELWAHSALARDRFGLSFLFTSNWDPALNQSFGALPFIQGTLVTSAVALVLALPVSLGVAVFLAELVPGWLRQPLGLLVELTAAVPSVVFGLWGLFVFIPVLVRPVAESLERTMAWLPLFQGPVYGPSRLAASMILAIMISPTIIAISRDVFRAIPAAQREAALALGATRWEMISQVLIPYGSSGLLGAVILGLGRALGETMAVTMVIGNNLDLTASLLHPGYTMASLIANEFSEATYELYQHALIEIGLVLFAITLGLNLVARLLVWRVAGKGTREARA
jgi:phosphate transport system permease protein